MYKMEKPNLEIEIPEWIRKIEEILKKDDKNITK